MAEQDNQDIQPSAPQVGARLCAAREAQGLGRADIAARTKIAERHLISIEEERFADLASRTYAVGFSRAYARAVGLDEAEIAQGVRDALDAIEQHSAPRQPAPFEPGDPARIPAVRTAWVAAVAALLVLAGVFAFWRSYFDPAVTLPDLAPEKASAAKASDSTARRVAVSAPAQPSGPVVFTALDEGIWVKFYDASGAQLMQKQMSRGETYTVPVQAQSPQLWTGRPDALAITVNGRPVPPLADRQIIVKDVPVSAAALLQRRPAADAVGATSTVSN